MRIIDKQQDYYDYLQDYSDSLVFDRRDSFVLTKERVCDCFDGWSYGEPDSDYRFVTLQCGATFWLLLATITKRERRPEYVRTHIQDYDLDVLATWKNYDAPNELLLIKTIDAEAFPCYYKMTHTKKNGPKHALNLDGIKSNISDLIDAINHHDFNKFNMDTLSESYISRSAKNGHDTQKLTKPLLKACGISNAIDAQEIFCAIEEYFSIEKTAAERTEAIGTTNNDKITMHGFDLKTSFRGKCSAT